MTLFIILLSILFIILLPIPIKIKAYYSNKSYYLKLYGINLYSDDDGIIRKLLSRKSKTSNKNNKRKKQNINNDKKEASNKNHFSLRRTYQLIQSNRFKPSIKFHLLGNYCLNDAALTALLYGFLCNFNFILLKLFSDVFKVKRFNYSLDPNFKNQFNINLTFNCIITFNFAQIIYILFLIRKKEVSL